MTYFTIKNSKIEKVLNLSKKTDLYGISEDIVGIKTTYNLERLLKTTKIEGLQFME